MRSRTTPEKPENRSRASNVSLLYRRALLVRSMPRVSVRCLTFCASLLAFGCAVRPAVLVPPITAASHDQTIDLAPASVARVSAPTSAAPAVQTVNQNRKVARTRKLSSAKQKQAAGGNRPSASKRLHTTPAPHVEKTATRNSQSIRAYRAALAAKQEHLAAAAEPTDGAAEAEPVSNPPAKPKPAHATTAAGEPPAGGKRDGREREDQSEPGRIKIAAVPAILPGSDDLSLRIVREDDAETRAARIPSLEPRLAMVSTPRDLSGTFAGTSFRYAKGQISLAEITFNIIGSGSDVTGTWSSPRGTSGRLGGTIEGSAIRGLRLEQDGPCSGTYAGLAIVVREGSMLDGSYAGADCEGKVDGSFIVRKQ
jgi:hypothetical protein